MHFKVKKSSRGFLTYWTTFELATTHRDSTNIVLSEALNVLFLSLPFLVMLHFLNGIYQNIRQKAIEKLFVILQFDKLMWNRKFLILNFNLIPFCFSISSFWLFVMWSSSENMCRIFFSLAFTDHTQNRHFRSAPWAFAFSHVRGLADVGICNS